ncbi:MAG: glycogen-binding domain-containing protein [Chitinophagales bacterium]
MNKLLTYCLLCLFLIIGIPDSSSAQITGNAVRVEGNMVVVKIKQRSPDYQKLMMYFGLDEDSLFIHHSLGQLSKEGWKIRKITKRKAIITKVVGDDNMEVQWGNQPIFFNLNVNENNTPGYPGPVSFGINNFKGAPTVYENDKDITVFKLLNFPQASKVFLSGNFNDWSTGQTPMQKTDSGWIAEVKLKPGKYFYKFIIDGQWMQDINNNLRESDGHNNYNSTYYHYNYNFKLEGLTDKKNIILAGSFNNWNEKELKMQKTATGWVLPMFLKDGTHTYKFIADGEWILDPGNSAILPDGMGNINSVITLGDPYNFTLKGYQNANAVVLAGSFNNWNAGELIMQKTETGWQLPFVLAPGNYEYKFIVDGNWITDPANPVTTKLGETINSFIVISANHLFTLSAFPTAKEVYITGSFCGWAEPGYKMYNDNGVWKFPCYLPAGKYTYKLIVDGKWMLDPGNNNTEQNEFGTGNCVLWVSPESEFLEK